MTRPQVVRADTLDLQPQEAPSAKDHSRQPAHPAPLGAGPPAPHQSLSLRNAEQEAYQEQHQSPRASEEQIMGQTGAEDPEYDDEPEQMNGNEAVMHKNQSMQNGAYRRHDDEQTLVGGYSSGGDEETLVGDQEGDDEDMMDKISSSPSIDDGVFPLPHVRRTSVAITGIIPSSSFSASPLSSSQHSSSPYTQIPRDFPLPLLHKPRHRDTSSNSGKNKLFPLGVLGRKSSGSLPTTASPLNPDSSSSKPAAPADLWFNPDPKGLRSPNVSRDHHHSRGGYKAGNPFKKDSLKDRSNSSNSTSTDSHSSGSTCSSNSTGSVSSGGDTDSIDSDQESYVDMAKRLLRGKKKETDYGTDSESENDSDVDIGDATEMARVRNEDTVREVKKIGDCLLPEDDPLLAHHPGPNDPDKTDTVPGLSDDDDSSIDEPDYPGPLVLDEKQRAYMRNVRELIKIRGRDQNPGPLQIYDDDDPEKAWMKDDSLYLDPRFVGRGWAARCLQYAEDIDFEFVYALHTFVATVEGQANCTKGDTMVLLDDSNSYWWLVRVVKDGSIGYLPAEHIETPTERLARLNKHRNIDLAQTMLGDNPEKSKNPLKKAMKRRNAKTVQFAAPTYVEPSDVDYSSEEEGAEQGVYGDQVDPQLQGQENQQVAAAAVEPLKIKTQGAAAQKTDSVDDMTPSPEKTGSDDEMLAEKQGKCSPTRSNAQSLTRGIDGSSPRSRNGVLRNTDSFFKDDKAETRKITLTPNLLRDDSGKEVGDKEVRDITLGSRLKLHTDSFNKLKTRGSLETFEKIISPTEQANEDRKRKDKKPGMLSSLFKRKDRKSKAPDEDIEDPKKSEDSLRSSSSSQEARPSASSVQPSSPQRQVSKLQKSPPPELSPVRTTGFQSLDAQSLGSGTTPISLALKENAAPNTLRQVGMEPEEAAVQNATEVSPGTDFEESPDRPKPGPNSFTRPPRAAPAAESSQRYAMDDFDSLDEVQPQHDTTTESSRDAPPTIVERLSESPIQVSPMDAHAPHDPPGLMVDTSSQEEPSGSPISPASSTQIIEAPESKTDERDVTPGSTATSSVPTPTWSDAGLRAYLDNDQDQEIRDLMRIIEDTTGVQPAGPEHPIVGNLYAEERKRLAELTVELDHMHRAYLDRRGIRY